MTKITYREVHVGADLPLDIEHADGAVVTVLSAEHTGGGSERPVLLRYIVVEAEQRAKAKK